ncbi:hypothetical protein HDU79_008976 [Rhizoclosmatium sp. JEL0117]|nr:hypothetical protein HDU79_008976 [Rhizoclosmatium sp. JEL0117]
MQSTDTSDFFQSDRDIELAQQRERKKKAALEANAAATTNHASLLRSTSKVLCIEQISNQKSGLVAVVGESGHVARKIDLETGTPIVTFKGHKGPVTCVAIEYDPVANADRFVYTGSWDKSIKKFDASTGELLATFTGHADFVKTLILVPSPSGLHLLSGSSDNTIKKWDPITGALLQTWKGHTRPVESLVFVEGEESGEGQELSQLKGHLTSVYKLHITEDGELWSASADKTVKRWNLEAAISDSTFEHPDFVKCVAVVHGNYVVTGGRDENIRVFDLTSEKCINIIEGHFGEISCLFVSGGRLWSGSLDATIRSWSLEDILKPNTAAVQSHTESMAAEANGSAASAAESLIPGKGASLMTEEEERELAELMDEDD